ncbi:MAG: Aspartate aminotransferase [Chlamydiales bacterium]|nr:Aspartate aminotransferase [Chlamydiales bacterium]
MNFFEKVELAPADAIFGLMRTFINDERKNKVNLIAGVYRTEELKPLILDCVKEAEQRLLLSERSKDYLPIDGLGDYTRLTEDLVFGHQAPHIYGAQTVGGTAALRVGGRFLKEQGFSKIYLSDPTWDNHTRIFQAAGLELASYPYFNRKTNGLDFEGMVRAMDQMEERSVILLHACCHNPSGWDPTLDQWQLLLSKIQEKKLFPFFDFAYQGFGESIEKDAAAVRLFEQAGSECAVAVSHSKNFGLYAERCGALFFVTRDAQAMQRVGSCVKVLIRGMYSNPPVHGAQIVTQILQEAALRKQWEEELGRMRLRICRMRTELSASLKAALGSDHFDFLNLQKGMFSYTGLNSQQVHQLVEKYSIYLAHDGRMNVAGLNPDNLGCVVESISQLIQAHAP